MDTVTPFLGWPMKATQPVSANPANSLLVIANMQNDFCKPGGVIFEERRPPEMPGVTRLITELAEKARRVGISVIHIRSLRTLAEPEFTAYGHKPYAKADTWGAQIIDELTPHSSDTVVDSWQLDPFYASGLDHVLQGLVEEPTRTQAIVTGGDLGGFGLQTAVGFYLRNYWTVVPIDTMYGDEEGQDFAFKGRLSADSQKNIFLSRSDLITCSAVPERGVTGLVPGD